MASRYTMISTKLTAAESFLKPRAVKIKPIVESPTSTTLAVKMRRGMKIARKTWESSTEEAIETKEFM